MEVYYGIGGFILGFLICLLVIRKNKKLFDQLMKKMDMMEQKLNLKS